MGSYIPFLNMFGAADAERRSRENKDTNSYGNRGGYDVLGRGLDPTGLVSGRTAWGTNGWFGSGVDVGKMLGFVRDKEDTRSVFQKLREDNPQLFQQLMDQAGGQGGSAAETLGRKELADTQAASLGTAASGIGGGNPATAMRQAVNVNSRMGLEGEQQIMAMRQQEQARAQAVLIDAMMKGASLDDAMTMFRAQMAQRRGDMQTQMMAQGLGAGLAALTSRGAQQQGGFGDDWAAFGNMGAGGGARGPYGGGTFQPNYGQGGQQPAASENVDAPMYGQGGGNSEPPPWF